MDLSTLFAFKQAWNSFKRSHPKFPEFLKAVKNRGISEGTELTVTVTYPDGQTYRAGLKLKESDMELINTVAGLVSSENR